MTRFALVAVMALICCVISQPLAIAYGQQQKEPTPLQKPVQSEVTQKDHVVVQAPSIVQAPTQKSVIQADKNLSARHASHGRRTRRELKQERVQDRRSHGPAKARSSRGACLSGSCRRG